MRSAERLNVLVRFVLSYPEGLWHFAPIFSSTFRPGSFWQVPQCLRHVPGLFHCPSGAHLTLRCSTFHCITGSIETDTFSRTAFLILDEQTRELIRYSLNWWKEHSCLEWKENGEGKPKVKFFAGKATHTRTAQHINRRGRLLLPAGTHLLGGRAGDLHRERMRILCDGHARGGSRDG